MSSVPHTGSFSLFKSGWHS